MKVALFTTHPIQYQIPWFRALSASKEIQLTVYYAMIPDPDQQGAGFGIPFRWDVPLLDGYTWKVLRNSGSNPDLRRFFSVRTPNISSVLKKQKPDAAIIMGWNSFFLIQALIACRLTGTPSMVRGDSNALKKRKPWISFIQRILISQYDVYLSVGKSNTAFYLNLGVLSEKIFPCRHFVDNDFFLNRLRTNNFESNRFRRKWSIPQDNPCLLFAGKLIEKKKIMDFLKAASLLLQKGTNIHVFVVGDGEQMETAQSYVKNQGIPASFAGFLNQTEIVTAYATADCLILPSDYGETWGLVVNESMVCGLPAIVSDRVGCGPDLVLEGVTGYVFPFGDINALAERMLQIASNREKRESMGQRARERVMEHYSIEKAVEGTLKALYFAVNRKGA